MQNALGLMSDQTIMIGITAALALLGVGALFMALFWPRRWRLKYRIEVGFVVLLAGLAAYADINSAQTYGAYEADLPTAGALAGAAAEASEAADFDRSIGVYAFQWGFVFLDEQGAASRNAIDHVFGQPSNGVFRFQDGGRRRERYQWHIVGSRWFRRRFHAGQ